MTITSTSNSQVVLLKKILSEKKFRKEFGLYCIEGEKLVADALRFDADVEKIFLKESFECKLEFPSKIETVVVADSVFDKLSSQKTSQGIAALVKIPQDSGILPDKPCLVLENLQDNGNIGTLLRTAVATDFLNVLLVNCADVFSPKTVRAAMSAHFVLNLKTFATIEEAFEKLKGFSVICADMNGQSVFDFNCPKKFALVLGNEGNGVSDFVKNNATATVSLSMKNNLESLNVSVAGSVIMYLLKANNS